MSITKYLEEKWRKGFRLYDMDKDEFLTINDFESLAATISKETGATEEETLKTREDWVQWGKRLLKPAINGRLSEEEFIQVTVELYKDIDNLRRLNTETYSMLFDNLDLDKDGQISIDELRIFYAGHRVKDEMFVRRVFDQLDTNKDGYIDRDELIKAGVNYWTSSDENDGYAFMYDPSSFGDESA